MIVPCPIFKWERECENCGATIEVYYPPDVAFEFKLGNVKEICVEREKGLEFAHKAIVLDNQCLVIANVCPLCKTPIKELDLYFELISMLFNGIDVQVGWVAFESDDFCSWCDKRLSELRVAEIESEAWDYKRRIITAMNRKDRDAGYLVQNLYSIIYHPLCRECEGNRNLEK